MKSNSKMQDMLNTYNEQKQHAQFMLISVNAFDNAPEIIINPKENFEAKMDYYQKAYDEDLQLKTNENIRITDFMLTDDILQVVDFLDQSRKER